MNYLGVCITPGEIHMEEDKVAKVKEWKEPTNVKEVRRFLKFTGHYRYFIYNYSAIARPLLELTRKASDCHWNPEQQHAFETLRNKIYEQPFLRQPDFTKTFFVHV